MEIATFLTIWLAAGAIGSALVVEFFWRRGECPMDFNVGDLLFFSTMAAIAGPINLIIGVLFFIGWTAKKAMLRAGIGPHRVLLRAKRP